VLYIGRLLEGKGTETLLRAWRELPSIRLKILGDGALRTPLEGMARHENLNVEFMGRQDRDAVLDALGKAELLVVPSECYEGFPLVVAESFACGTPILASRIGSLDELVEEGVTGAKFPAGDEAALAASVRRLLADQPSLHRMRTAARAYFDAHLTEEQNFTQLMNIYSDVTA
jgi:glycosyltransferase involved in cell wall biosynthesis